MIYSVGWTCVCVGPPHDDDGPAGSVSQPTPFHTQPQNPLLTPKKLTAELAKLLRLRREERREAIEAALFEAVRQRSWFLPHRPGWVTVDPEGAKLLGLPHAEKDEALRTMRLVELNAKVEGA